MTDQQIEHLFQVVKLVCLFGCYWYYRQASGPGSIPSPHRSRTRPFWDRSNDESHPLWDQWIDK